MPSMKTSGLGTGVTGGISVGAGVGTGVSGGVGRGVTGVAGSVGCGGGVGVGLGNTVKPKDITLYSDASPPDLATNSTAYTPSSKFPKSFFAVSVKLPLTASTKTPPELKALNSSRDNEIGFTTLPGPVTLISKYGSPENLVSYTPLS